MADNYQIISNNNCFLFFTIIVKYLLSFWDKEKDEDEVFVEEPLQTIFTRVVTDSKTRKVIRFDEVSVYPTMLNLILCYNVFNLLGIHYFSVLFIVTVIFTTGVE